MSKSTENRVVIEMRTTKPLSGKEAAALVETALAPRYEFEEVRALQFKRVIAKLDDHKKFNRTLKSVTKSLKRGSGNGQRHP